MEQFLDKIMASKEQAEAFLAAVSQKYLEKLQSGEYGIPSQNELMNAGLLHQFLENLASNREDKG